ncbi:hypothetical protein ACH5RR_001665 [Cinchona calisaya]|uniref:RNase H type-1 domain-containing protein n=1 Tax=Cinchona calisaya TaxID=153742 RepID=A0ABD3B4B2_9GENT
MHSVQRAMSEWLEFVETQKGDDYGSKVETAGQQDGTEWRTPQSVFVKNNTNAVVKGEDRRAGRAGIARDKQGRVLKCWITRTLKVGNAWMEEALAIREAMCMPEDAGECII